jgi:hypothetical protein
MGFQQTVIRHKTESGKTARRIVRYGTDIKVGNLLGYPQVIFQDQEDGSVNSVSLSLVLEVFVEEEDPKYGTFHKVRTVEI